MNDKKIWDYLILKIGNPYGVGALMGNLYVESKLNPMLLESSYARKFGMTSEEYTNAVNNGTYTNFVHDSAGYGIVQWTYWSRKEGLYDFAKERNVSIADLEMQLDYLWKELQGYKTVLTALYTAKNVREASDVVVKRYERPKHQEEEYLANRAKYGQGFYDKYSEDVMYDYQQVKDLLYDWKKQGLKAPDIVVNLANACIGWNYIFGDRGEECVPSHVKSRISSLSKDYPKEAESLKGRCQVALNKAKDCDGCRFHPNGVTLAYDCRGFTYWCFLNGANIEIKGGGASSQYNNNANWSEKGPISKMPKDKVCCVFRYDSSTGKYEHTLIYDGQGNYIHDSLEVKKTPMSKYKATHYAIPKGLYDGGGDKPVVCTATVHADSGSTVRMRSQPSTSSSVICTVYIGSVVDVLEKGTEWSNIRYKNQEGYMMNQFLIFHDEPTPSPTPSEDTVTVKKSDLELIYNMVGSMLNGKG